MQRKVLITAALPYANGPLHLGHIAGAYLPADCFARFSRLTGADVLFLCGSDEHGVAITLTAEACGRTPQEHVDHFHKVNSSFFAQLHISFDHYSRTTWEGHVQTTQEFFKDLLANGYIKKHQCLQLYSELEKRFLADRYVIGQCPKCHFEQARGDECPKCGGNFEATDLLHPKSKLTNAPLELKETEHFFLHFDQFKERLQEWLSTKTWKSNVTNFVKPYVEELRPRAITRDCDWGVPLPIQGYEDKVFYVWFDAPIGYISAAKEWAEKVEDKTRWRDYWCDARTELVHFLGKDNIPFHAIFFPAMIMGQNTPYKLVDVVAANEFYNLEGKQFSKSSGWTIDLDLFLRQFSVDQIRYTIAANAPETQDSEFTWDDFQMRCNRELLGKYGNLVNRVLVFHHKILGSFAIKPEHFETQDLAFLDQVRQITKQIHECYSTYSLRRACQCIMELAHVANTYFDAQKPWQAAKDLQLKLKLQQTLYCCLESLKYLSLVSYPIIPNTAEALWAMLGFKEKLEDQTWRELFEQPFKEGQSLQEPKILFAKVEDEVIALQKAKLVSGAGA